MKEQKTKQIIAANLGILHLKKNEQDKIINQMLDNISSVVTIAAWRRLSKQDKKELVKQREILQEQFRDFLNKIDKLKNY